MLAISKHVSRTFPGNPVTAPVHVFAAPHDRLALRALPSGAAAGVGKRLASATLSPSLSDPARGAHRVLLASANATLSAALEAELGCVAEVQPLAAVERLAEVAGMDLVVLLTAHCDPSTNETWWELYHHKPEDHGRERSLRRALQWGFV